MIKVKFFGVLRLDLKTTETEIEAKTLKELYEKLSKNYEQLNPKTLKNYITFVNGINSAKLKMQKTKLNPSDEVVIISPVAGG
jgi:molybdopterin converting factor small subunit